MTTYSVTTSAQQVAAAVNRSAGERGYSFAHVGGLANIFLEFVGLGRTELLMPGGEMTLVPGVAVRASTTSGTASLAVTALAPDLPGIPASEPLRTATATVDSGTYAPKPTGTPTVGQVPVVTTVSPLALGWGAGGGGGVPNISGLDLSHLGKWVRAKARVYAGTQDAKILCIGDSGTEGAGSSTISTFPERSAWPARMAALLTAGGLPAASGLGVPRYNTILQADNRWTIGTGWLPSGGMGILNACAYTASSPASPLVYADPTILADSFDVYYLTNTGLGTLNITATGSSVVNQSANAAGSVQKVTVTAASAATTNTCSISGTGNVYVVGVEPFLSTTKKVRIGNVAAGGTSANTWALATGGTFAGDKVIQAYAPDLTFIGLGLNDATVASPTNTLMTNLTTIRGFVTTGDVAFITWIPSNDGARTPYEPGYIAGIAATFGPTNAVFDYYTRVGSYANALALGLSAGDNLHPSDLGYYDIGQWAARGLLSV